MADAARYLYIKPAWNAVLFTQHFTAAAEPALAEFAQSMATVGWTRAEISAAIKSAIANHGLKMPQLMMPLRVLMSGQTQTPALDGVIAVLGREEVLARLNVRLTG
jgi:glutamyl-tRNA synthetase